MNVPPTPEVGWQDVLNQTRRNFGPAPRQFGWLRRYALRLPRPRWYRPGEAFPALEQIIAQQAELWRNGEIVWGAILQATDALFAPGIDDLPAVVMYSFDPQCERNLLGLAQAAKQVAGLAANVNLSDADQHQRRPSWEGEAPAEPFTSFLPSAQGLNILNASELPAAVSPRARLQSELAAPIRYEIPLALTAMMPMIATTVLVRRLHLPGRKLTNGYLPLVVDRVSGTTAILPSRYWPREVLADWQRE